MGPTAVRSAFQKFYCSFVPRECTTSKVRFKVLVVPAMKFLFFWIVTPNILEILSLYSLCILLGFISDSEDGGDIFLEYVSIFPK
jgi:hypothetical protein